MPAGGGGHLAVDRDQQLLPPPEVAAEVLEACERAQPQLPSARTRHTRISYRPSPARRHGATQPAGCCEPALRGARDAAAVAEHTREAEPPRAAVLARPQRRAHAHTCRSRTMSRLKLSMPVPRPVSLRLSRAFLDWSAHFFFRPSRRKILLIPETLSQTFWRIRNQRKTRGRCGRPSARKTQRMADPLGVHVGMGGGEGMRLADAPCRAPGSAIWRAPSQCPSRAHQFQLPARVSVACPRRRRGWTRAIPCTARGA